MDFENGKIGECARDPMDEGEVAKDYADRHNQSAIDRVLADARRPVGLSLEICEGCEEEIPEERREKQPGCTRCVACQSVFERLKGGM